MDEVKLFAEIRPASPDDLGRACAAARLRLTEGIAGTVKPARRTRHWLGFAAGVAGVAAAAAVVVPAVLPGGAGGSFAGKAWAAEQTRDGYVKMSIAQGFNDPSGLQRVLRADGINAVVRMEPVVRDFRGPGHHYVGCAVRDPARAAVQRAVIVAGSRYGAGVSGWRPDALAGPRWSWTIRPAAMPPGDVLLIQIGVPSRISPAGDVFPPVVLNGGKLPECAS